MTLDDILAEIKNAENIVVMAHEQPDGDAIGSSLAMCLVLKNMGKNVCYVLDEDDYPETFNYLPGKELITSNPDIEKFDLAICMDCPNIKRVSANFRKYFEEAEGKPIKAFRVPAMIDKILRLFISSGGFDVD